ncbi:MAG: hypothetical protein AB1896_08480 [Thermodesulfobacteriota bacterium]
MKIGEIQVLCLLKLLFTSEEPMVSKLSPRLDAGQRKSLLDTGLIRLEKRGRATHVVLTDKAWAWAAENLDAPFSTRSPAVAVVLKAALAALKRYMETEKVALAEILASAGGEEAPGRTLNFGALEPAVRAAYQRLSGGRWNVRVRLSDLRRALPDMPRPDLDAALLRMQDEEKLVLYHLDDPLDRGPDDEEAALDIVGHKRHLVYLRG